MRFAILAILLGLVVLLMLAFVPSERPDLSPQATQTKTDAPEDASLAVTQVSPVDWRALEAAPGDWTWSVADGQSKAEFAGGQFTVMCAPELAQVSLLRSGPTTDGIVFDVWTTHDRRRYRADTDEGSATVTLAADDPILDAMALSRGHFGIAAQGSDPLLIPSWSEVTRVIEDCRG